MTIGFLLTLIAFVLFLLAALGVPSRVHFGWLGAAVLALGLLL